MQTAGATERPQDSPSHLDYPDWTIPEILHQASAHFPSHAALRFFGRSMDYRHLQREVDAFARGLLALGLKAGDRVALVLPNAPQFVIAYFGTLQAGGVVVATNPLYTPREFETQFEDAKPTFVVALDLVAERVRGAIGEARLVVTRIREYLPRSLALLQRIAQPGPKMPDGTLSFREILRRGETGDLPAPGSPDELAVLQYTGGTTGTPKAAMLSHRNLVANAMQCQAWLPDYHPGDERVLAVLPFFHVFGMTVAMNLGVLCGGEIDLVPRFSPGQMAKEVRRFQPSFFPGAPALYESVVMDPHAERWNMRSIRYCISGSAPLALTLQERFERLTGGVLVEGYGLTEAAPVTHCNPLRGQRKIGSVGRPFPDTEQRIVDPDDPTRDMPLGEEGELAVRGPQVMLGYYGRPKETQSVLKDGWLLTGDIGVIDEDGFCRIVDRKKDLIIVSGFNVYPREVEEVLLQYPGVREAAVVGVPDERRGQAVRAVLVPDPGTEIDLPKLQAFCREQLAGYKTPRQFELRTELPRSVIGKVLRRELVPQAKEES
ncbi:MAG: long-chain fatty acid--CoA ligase [Thermaerobacter sp.]|nr:long-chain fatty acid--CoA ligase [Thermaerobacter sp.]